jgi:hypothetical protein
MRQSSSAGHQPAETKLDPEQKRYDPYSDLLYRLYLLATILGVFFGLIGIFYLIRSANASTTAANAAMLSAQGVMKAERGWYLLERIDTPNLPANGYANCTIQLRNYGNTPIRIISGKFELQIGDKNSEPPRAADVFSVTLAPNIADVIPPRKRTTAIANLTPNPLITFQQRDDILVNKTKFLWVCGIVNYHDVFEGTTEAHKTLFCCLYQTLSGPTHYWAVGGQDKHNSAT